MRDVSCLRSTVVAAHVRERRHDSRSAPQRAGHLPADVQVVVRKHLEGRGAAARVQQHHKPERVFPAPARPPPPNVVAFICRPFSVVNIGRSDRADDRPQERKEQKKGKLSKSLSMQSVSGSLGAGMHCRSVRTLNCFALLAGTLARHSTQSQKGLLLAGGSGEQEKWTSPRKATRTPHFPAGWEVSEARWGAPGPQVGGPAQGPGATSVRQPRQQPPAVARVPQPLLQPPRPQLQPDA